MTPRLSEVALLFFKNITLTLGGGNVAAASLQRELIERKWLTPEQYGLCYSLSRVTPGTNLFALTAASSWLMLGSRGVAVTLLLASAPVCFLVWLITLAFSAIQANAYARTATDGAIAAAVGATLAAFWQLAGSSLMGEHRWRSAAICVAAFALPYFGWLSPVATLLLAALVGWFWRPKT